VFKKILIGVGTVFAFFLVVGLLSGCGSKTDTPTNEAPTVIVTEAPKVEPTAVPTPTSIEPCVDGSQDSCQLYAITLANFITEFPDASLEWSDCVATNVSNSYTLEEFTLLSDQAMQALALDNLSTCGEAP